MSLARPRGRRRRLVVVLTLLLGCAKPPFDPANGRFAPGDQAVLVNPRSPMDVMVPRRPSSAPTDPMRQAAFPAGTRVRVDGDTRPLAVNPQPRTPNQIAEGMAEWSADERWVDVTVLDGEHSGYVGRVMRVYLRPAGSPPSAR